MICKPSGNAGDELRIVWKNCHACKFQLHFVLLSLGWTKILVRCEWTLSLDSAQCKYTPCKSNTGGSHYGQSEFPDNSKGSRSMCPPMFPVLNLKLDSEFGYFERISLGIHSYLPVSALGARQVDDTEPVSLVGRHGEHLVRRDALHPVRELRTRRRRAPFFPFNKPDLVYSAKHSQRKKRR